MSFLSSLFFGSPEKHDRVSTLQPDQQQLFSQLLRALQGAGAGGAFGDSADYYRDLLSDDPRDFEAFAAPEMRRFREETIPGLAEQFAGMGSGALSSSGFRNASVNEGANLNERLAAIRANLRQQGAQGLSGLASQGLGNYSQDVITQPGSEGLLSQLGPALGTAAGSFFGPMGGALGNSLASLISGKGASNPYGSPNPRSGQPGRF